MDSYHTSVDICLKMIFSQSRQGVKLILNEGIRRPISGARTDSFYASNASIQNTMGPQTSKIWVAIHKSSRFQWKYGTEYFSEVKPSWWFQTVPDHFLLSQSPWLLPIVLSGFWEGPWVLFGSTQRSARGPCGSAIVPKRCLTDPRIL